MSENRTTPVSGNAFLNRNIAVSIQGTYESCDRRTLYVYIQDADAPHDNFVPCYSGQHLCDAITQLYELADFFGIERPSVQHLVSDTLFSQETIDESLNDVVYLLDKRIQLKAFVAEKKRKKAALKANQTD